MSPLAATSTEQQLRDMISCKASNEAARLRRHHVLGVGLFGFGYLAIGFG